MGAIALGIVLRTDANGEPKTGIRGVVRVGCPGDRPCGWVPTSAALQVIRYAEARRRGTLVKRFRSASDGSFKVALPPGRYLVKELPGQPLGLLTDAHVVIVRQSHMTKLSLLFDTGMR
jgi:hypothetical protein